MTKVPRAQDRGQHLKVHDPRHLAWSVLDSVERHGSYANVLLPQTLRESRLDTRDRGFVTDVVYTTLRWRGFLDAVIEQAASRPLTSIDATSLTVLRMQTAQLLVLGGATHACVSTAVDLVASVGSHGAKGFVNAVMRAIAQHDFPTWQHQVSTVPNHTDALALRLSHPRWIVTALRDALLSAGRSETELEQLLQANNDPVRPTLCVRPGLADPEQVLRSVAGHRGQWSDLAITQIHGDVGAIEDVRAGRVAAQDEGSQVVALIAGGLAVEGPDEQWLDLCAGPGGKAAVLAGLGLPRGAHLTAVDVHEHRAALTAQTTREYPHVRCFVADSTNLASEDWYADAAFDRVLLDAPCSGIGSLRRRPDLRWQRKASDVADLAPLQERLLLAALAAVRPGGVVTYATCSPHVSETSVVIARSRQAAANAGLATELLHLPALLENIPGLLHATALSQSTRTEHFVHMWPHVHETDGMFVAALRRI